jgi:hypothetical protein
MIDMGNVRILVPDNKTRADTGIILGAAQAEDCRLAMLTNKKAFTVFAHVNPVRNPTDPVSGLTIGSRANVEDNALSENDIILSKAIDSIMSPNGLPGGVYNFLYPRFDHHGGYAAFFQKPADVNNYAESFYTIGVASSNGSGYHTDGTVFDVNGDRVNTLVEGQTYDDARLDYMARENASQFSGYKVYDARGEADQMLRLDVYDNEFPPRVEAHIMRSGLDDGSIGDYNDVWSRKWVRFYTDNEGVSVDAIIDVPKLFASRHNNYSAGNIM